MTAVYLDLNWRTWGSGGNIIGFRFRLCFSYLFATGFQFNSFCGMCRSRCGHHWFHFHTVINVNVKFISFRTCFPTLTVVVNCAFLNHIPQTTILTRFAVTFSMLIRESFVRFTKYTLNFWVIWHLGSTRNWQSLSNGTVCTRNTVHYFTIGTIPYNVFWQRTWYGFTFYRKLQP